MNWAFRLAVLSCCFAACLDSVAVAGPEARPLNANLKHIRLEKEEGSKPKNKDYSYAGGKVAVEYHGHGQCSVGADFLAAKYHWNIGTSVKLRTDDVVALLGGVFRAECQDSFAVLERIPDDKLPKGTRSPAWDSISVPFTGRSGFDAVGLKVLEHATKTEKDTSVLLEIKIGTREEAMRGKRPIIVFARVKAGESVLLNGNGHLVRAIVPPNPTTRVVGWVELSPHPIPEADLIRDKKVFIRPAAEKPPEDRELSG